MPSPRTLVIDDAAAIRRAVVDALRAAGYEPIAAVRGDDSQAGVVRAREARHLVMPQRCEELPLTVSPFSCITKSWNSDGTDGMLSTSANTVFCPTKRREDDAGRAFESDRRVR
jgi:CheY-like chemotaxis protein